MKGKGGKKGHGVYLFTDQIGWKGFLVVKSFFGSLIKNIKKSIIFYIMLIVFV